MLEAAQKAEAAAASPTPLRTFIDEVEDWERTAMLKNKDAGSKFKLIAKYKDVYLHIDAEDDDPPGLDDTWRLGVLHNGDFLASTRLAPVDRVAAL